MKCVCDDWIMIMQDGTAVERMPRNPEAMGSNSSRALSLLYLYSVCR